MGSKASEVTSTAVRGATAPPERREMGSGARCSRCWGRWRRSSWWRGWWSCGRRCWWSSRRWRGRRGAGGAGRQHDRRGDSGAGRHSRPGRRGWLPRRLWADSTLRSVPRGFEGLAAIAGLRVAVVGAEAADGGERDVERDRGAVVDRRVAVEGVRPLLVGGARGDGQVCDLEGGEHRVEHRRNAALGAVERGELLDAAAGR